MITFPPDADGIQSVQLVRKIQKVVAPEAVAHFEHPELCR